ncbi:unnamed protein product [Protopolystoma xenopodis]|uniref:Uncharacterized protein n=1 Tax=Protopolystoma xenopodis TaxID=117903 RepID=A0A3S5CFT2_9PLAT|nr:unnamed protein product [Protopolystoma xenopodis]
MAVVLVRMVDPPKWAGISGLLEQKSHTDRHNVNRQRASASHVGDWEEGLATLLGFCSSEQVVTFEKSGGEAKCAKMCSAKRAAGQRAKRADVSVCENAPSRTASN